MDSAPVVPPLAVVLVGGFLGSGKTTLMRRLIEDARDRRLRVAVVVNEFGEADVDSNILREADAELIASIAGGCACCGGQDDLQQTLLELAERPAEERPDAVLVEASGLADPVLLLDVLTAPALLSHVRVAFAVAVVDAMRPASAEDRLTPFLQRQVALSDLLIINKCDLAPDDRIVVVERLMQAVQPAARLARARHCDVDLDPVWASLRGQAEPKRRDDKIGEQPHTHYHTVVCPLPHPVDRSMLESELDKLGAGVWRVKGFARLRGEAGLHLVQYTGGYGGQAGGRHTVAPFHLSPGSLEPDTLLVFIGPQLDRQALLKTFGRYGW